MAAKRLGRAGLVAAIVLAACDDESLDPVAVGQGGGGAGGGELGTGAVAADCVTLCDATIALGCDDATCAPGCVQAHDGAGVCQPVLEGYIGCLAEHASEITSCTQYPAPCASAHDGFFSCSDSGDGCGPVECPEASEASCRCRVICAGATYEEACQTTAEGFSCTCEIDGAVMARCPASDNACAMFVGCCAPFLP